MNFGLSNPHLKIGVALLVLGPVLLTGSFLAHPGGLSILLMRVGFTLFVSGTIIYLAGRVAKALRSFKT